MSKLYPFKLQRPAQPQGVPLRDAYDGTRLDSICRKILDSLCWIIFLLAALPSSPALAALPIISSASSHHMHMALVAERTHPAPGKPLTLAIVMTPEPGWHGYGPNPGDAGFAPKFTWAMPKGVAAPAPQEITSPMPEKLVISGLVNFVYTGEHALLTHVQIGAIPQGTPLNIVLKADLLVCTAETCVPETAEAALDLVVGDGAADLNTAARFDHWRSALPQPIGAQAHYAVQGNMLRVGIPFPAATTAPVAPWLYATMSGVLKNDGVQTVRRIGDWLVITAPLDTSFKSGAAVPAIVRLSATQSVAIEARPGDVPSGGEIISSGTGAPDSPAPFSWALLLTALGGALLGGLILNIMPCVFPVIGLKALSLAKGGQDERAVRREVLAYAAGVVLFLLALGGLLLALRAGGAAIGWGFQLQNPWVVLALLLVMVAITLNLLGVYELPSFGGLQTKGDPLTRKAGMAGSFWTGALAALAATPCTGPFMAAALGAAIVMPWGAALLIFAGLGLGLAAPFLLLGFIPALRTRLPKPGAWMLRFKQLMAIPMGLTAVWLLWVLWREVDGHYLITIAGMIFITSNAAYYYGKDQRAGRTTRSIWNRVGGTTFIIIFLAWASGFIQSANKQPSQLNTSFLHAEPFNESRLADLRAHHTPVFLYFTADWCLTCKVNEKTALETEAVAHSFAVHHVVVMEGDWTHNDPAITHFIEGQGRSGVPLYLYYPANATAPQLLPQVLTAGALTALR